jgi:hypothetical protein
LQAPLSLREPTAEDQKPSPARKNEKLWQQIIGNVVSHQQSSNRIFNEALAVRTEEGIRVTEKGVEYLKSSGY